MKTYLNDDERQEYAHNSGRIAEMLQIYRGKLREQGFGRVSSIAFTLMWARTCIMNGEIVQISRRVAEALEGIRS